MARGIKIENSNLVVHVTGKVFNVFTSLIANERERAKMSFSEEVRNLITNWKTYGVDESCKSLRLIWNSAHHVDNDIDVSSVAREKRV